MNEPARIKRRRLGLCPTCGRVRDRKGHTTCNRCIESAQQRRRNKRAKGLCVDCGGPSTRRRGVWRKKFGAGVTRRCIMCAPKHQERKAAARKAA